MSLTPTFSRGSMERAGFERRWRPVTTKATVQKVDEAIDDAKDAATAALALVGKALGLPEDSSDGELAQALERLIKVRDQETRTEASAVLSAAANEMVKADSRLSYGEALRRMSLRLPELYALTRPVDR